MFGGRQNGYSLLLFLAYFITSSPLLNVIVQAIPSTEVLEENPAVSEVLKWNTDRLIEANNEDDDALAKIAADKRYMRFGRAPTEEKRQEEEKRYMRFGRSPSDWFHSENLAADKRYMRFGRSFRDQMNLDENQDAEKRYMRFGRSYDSGEHEGIEEDKRYMRFGRNAAEEKDERKEDKRYMRFGKRVFYDTAYPDVPLAAKRYMRFGRKLPDDFMSRPEDELPTDKRYMRFGRSIPEGKQGMNHQMDGLVNSAAQRSARISRSVPSNQDNSLNGDSNVSDKLQDLQLNRFPH